MPSPQGHERTERIDTSVINSFVMPDDINMITVYNSHATAKGKFCFEDDDTDDFRTLEPLDDAIRISVLGGRTICFDDFGTSVIFELIMWGE